MICLLFWWFSKQKFLMRVFPRIFNKIAHFHSKYSKYTLFYPQVSLQHQFVFNTFVLLKHLFLYIYLNLTSSGDTKGNMGESPHWLPPLAPSEEKNYKNQPFLAFFFVFFFCFLFSLGFFFFLIFKRKKKNMVLPLLTKRWYGRRKLKIHRVGCSIWVRYKYTWICVSLFEQDGLWRRLGWMVSSSLPLMPMTIQCLSMNVTINILIDTKISCYHDNVSNFVYKKWHDKEAHWR